MLQGIEIIFEDRDKMMAHLKKKTYKEYTENFIQNHGHYFEEMTTYVEGAKDKEAAAKEIGECLASAVKKTFVNKKGKIGARTQSDLNFFMIYYVFPTILAAEANMLRQLRMVYVRYGKAVLLIVISVIQTMIHYMIHSVKKYLVFFNAKT